jgi:hypothetical protein
LLTTDEDLYGLVPKEALRESLLATYSDEPDARETEIRRAIHSVNKRAV